MNKITMLALTCLFTIGSDADVLVTYPFADGPDATPGQAVPLDFSATDTDGISRSITAQAFTFANLNGDLAPSFVVNVAGSGLGACSMENQPACAGPSNAIDNPGFDDGVLMTFDSPIDDLTIELNGDIDGTIQDTDATVYFGTDDFDEATYFTNRIDSIGSGSRTVTVPLTEPVRWIIIAALNDVGGAQDNDYFFVESLTVSPLCSASEDDDGDGVPNIVDNCIFDANPSQLDTNGDQIGNACDADLNNDGTVNTVDLGILRTSFFATGSNDADFNGDGVVNPIDLGIMKQVFFGQPGPSCAIF